MSTEPSQGVAPNAVAKAILDKQFVKTFANQKTPEEQDKVFEEYFYGNFVSGLEADAKTKLDQLAVQVNNLTNQLSSSERTSISAQQEQNKLLQQLRDSEAQITTLKSDLEHSKAKSEQMN